MRSLPLLLALCASLTASAGVAAPPSGGQVPPAEHVCPHGERSALSELGCEVGAQLELSDATLVASAPLESDVAMERSAELIARLVRVMGGSLGSGLRLHTSPVPLGEARRLAARTGRLLYLTPELRHGRLRVSADVYVQPRAFWDRVKTPVAGPLQHAFAERPADSEVRTFLPRPPLLVTARDSAQLPERPVLALACGALEDARGDRLFIVGRHRVTAAQLRGGALRRLAQRDFQDMAGVAPTPLRAPLASARVRGPWLDVGSSDRVHALRLDSELQTVSTAPRALPWPIGGCAPLGDVAVEPRPRACFGEQPAAVDPITSLGPDHATAVDAFAAARLIAVDGSAAAVGVVRPQGQSHAWLVDDRGRRAELSDVGAQLALADLDGDGDIEIISSRPVLDPARDALRVDTWTKDGKIVRRFELPMPEVQAIAVCPWPGSGLAPIAVASADRVWVLR